MRRVVSRRSHCRHRAAAFGQGSHRHQHALDVRVLNDGHAGVYRAVDRPGLHAVLGVGDSLLVGPVGDRDALHANREPGGIHHDEHVFQAPVLLADQETHSARSTAHDVLCRRTVTELQHRRRRRLDPQLVLDADAVHVVALADGAVLADHELGHHEQADALDSFGGAGHPGQRQVHDVLRHVVLTVRDVDLGAEDAVACVRLRLGPRAHQRQIRTGLRLGEVHGAGPLAADQLFKERGVEFVRPRRQQCFDRAVGQQGAERETQVGRVDHFAACGADRLGQALAADAHRMLQALPAALRVLAECLPEARRGGDLAVFPARRIAVAFDVQRRDDLFVELGALLEHRLRGVESRVLEAGHLRDVVDAGQVPDVEQHVREGGFVAHGVSNNHKFEASPAMPCFRQERSGYNALINSGMAVNRSASSP